MTLYLDLYAYVQESVCKNFCDSQQNPISYTYSTQQLGYPIYNFQNHGQTNLFQGWLQKS